MQIITVIKMENHRIHSIHVYNAGYMPDGTRPPGENTEGVQEAEDKFTELLKEMTVKFKFELSDAELADHLDSGEYGYLGDSVTIRWADNWIRTK